MIERNGVPDLGSNEKIFGNQRFGRNKNCSTLRPTSQLEGHIDVNKGTQVGKG